MKLPNKRKLVKRKFEKVRNRKPYGLAANNLDHFLRSFDQPIFRLRLEFYGIKCIHNRGLITRSCVRQRKEYTFKARLFDWSTSGVSPRCRLKGHAWQDDEANSSWVECPLCKILVEKKKIKTLHDFLTPSPDNLTIGRYTTMRNLALAEAKLPNNSSLCCCD